MENLDNKYFETVIMALKKAKDTQKIEIGADFKAQLRAGIEKQALSMSVPAKPDWADLILRYKYILGGVPVLAVLTLVAINAMGFQVKMPKGQIIPATGTISESSANQSGQAVSDLTGDSSLQPRIQTFSSDLVMPPAEYLQNRGQTIVLTQTGSGEVNLSGQTDNPEYIFLDGVKVQLNFENTQSREPAQTNVPAAAQVEVSQDSSAEKTVLVTESDWRTISTLNPTIGATPTEAAARQELSGRVEQSGTVIVEPATETTPAAASTLATPTVNTLKTDAITQIQTTTSQPAVIQPLIQTAPASAPTVLPEVRTESIDYINPVVEQNVAAPKMTIQYRTLNVTTPQYLAADRIYFNDSTERTAVVEVVLKGLSSRNGNLSNDYYVNVVPLENGTYKAILYEFGQVKQVLILAQRDGKLAVVTELVY